VLAKEVNAPVERVYERLLDLESTATHLPNITRLEILTPGLVGEGTKFRETRVMFGKEATETMEITDVHPERSMTISATSCGSFFSTVFRLIPRGGGTLIEQVTSWRALTFMARFISP
jgi:hypothetical protein